MKALTYIEHGKFALMDKPIPEILDPRDAIVRVTLGSICTSALHLNSTIAALENLWDRTGIPGPSAVIAVSLHNKQKDH